jgi:hypothetical protein
MVPPMGWKSRVDYHPMIDRRNRPERRAGALPCILPNHKYLTFTIADLVTGVSDNCDSIAIGSVQIASVASDEPENGVGDGNTLNDIVIASDCRSVQLRSERMGGGDGCVYTITLRVADGSGNVSTTTLKVAVPQSQNGSAAVDSGVHYAVSIPNAHGKLLTLVDERSLSGHSRENCHLKRERVECRGIIVSVGSYGDFDPQFHLSGLIIPICIAADDRPRRVPWNHLCMLRYLRQRCGANCAEELLPR